MTLEEYEYIVHRIRPKLKKIAYRFFQNSEDTEDVVQEVLMKLWIRGGELNLEEAEKIAITATKNLCVSMLRRRKDRIELSINENMTIVDSVQPDTRMKAEEYQAMLEKAIGTLTKTERRLVKMVQQDDLNTKEIAIITGIQIRSVRSMLSAARKKLLKLLTQWNEH